MPATLLNDSDLFKEIKILQRLARLSMLVFIVCAAVMAVVFIYYADRLQGISEAQEMLLAERHANATSVMHAESIIAQIDRARLAKINGEWVDPTLVKYLDDIERLAVSIIGRQD